MLALFRPFDFVACESVVVIAVVVIVAVVIIVTSIAHFVGIG